MHCRGGPRIISALAPSNLERLFLENLGAVDDIVAFVASRHGLTTEEREELASGVRLKLIEDNYAVLRKFAGRSSLKTYLAAVANRYFLDRRIERWGRWRPSAEARRGGPVAVLLDQLMTRDGLSFEEAAESLRLNHGITESREALEALRPHTPRAPRRRFVGDEHLEEVTAGDGETAVIERLDRQAHASQVERALQIVLSRCEQQDRLILRLRFENGYQIVRIARLLNLDQRGLYRRLERIMAELRSELESAGVDRERVAAFLSEEPAKSSLVSVSVMRRPQGRTQAGQGPDHV